MLLYRSCPLLPLRYPLCLLSNQNLSVIKDNSLKIFKHEGQEKEAFRKKEKHIPARVEVFKAYPF